MRVAVVVTNIVPSIDCLCNKLGRIFNSMHIHFEACKIKMFRADTVGFVWELCEIFLHYWNFEYYLIESMTLYWICIQRMLKIDYVHYLDTLNSNLFHVMLNSIPRGIHCIEPFLWTMTCICFPSQWGNFVMITSNFKPRLNLPSGVLSHSYCNR